MNNALKFFDDVDSILRSHGLPPAQRGKPYDWESVSPEVETEIRKAWAAFFTPSLVPHL